MAPLTAQQLRRNSARRSWWRDGLEAAIYLVSAVGVAFVVAAGAFTIFQPIDWLYGLGRCAGVVATVFMLTQVLLASRAPFIENAVGHDFAMSLHTRLGKWAIILMIAHASVITFVDGYYDGRSILDQTVQYFTGAWYTALAQVALAIFLLILALSLAIIRKKWRYETWHLVHLLVYVAIASVVWHQFLFGSTFVTKGAAWWYWLSLYVVAFGSLLAFRVIRPLVRLRRYDLRVESVTALPDGSNTVVLSGRRLERLRAEPGQFFLWRFLAKGYWTQAHPFSLSRGPRGESLRITVKPSGDFSRSVGELKPGTRVLAEGPLGIFSAVTRSQPGLVLVAAGIGVTPILSMLEDAEGPVDVILRCSSEDEAPLLDELRALAAERGATLHVLPGPRGIGWAPAGMPATLSGLVPDIRERDVYVCGPLAWAREVVADAKVAGVPKESIHREEFAW